MATPYEPPSVHVQTTRPPGVLPKHLQAYVIGGIALAMVIVIAFSSRNHSQTPAAPPEPTPLSVDPNQLRIEEYRRRLEEQAQKLALEQVRVNQSRQALTDALPETMLSAGPGASDGGLTEPYPGSYPAAPGRERNWTELDREKRAYESRYASNVALTRRTPPPSVRGETATSPALVGVAPTGRNAQQDSGLAADDTAVHYRLLEGTVLETVLTNRLGSTFSGPVNALVAADVYAQDHSTLLVPKGSRVLGSVSRVDSVGQQRLAVTFARLMLPNGRALDLQTFPGLSQVGETGLLDQVNRHYAQIFGVSLAIGAIAGLSQAGTSYGGPGTGVPAGDVYRQGVTNSLSQTSLNILDRFLNVLPTFTVREGTRIKVYLTADLDVPAYEPSPSNGAPSTARSLP
jgi:type IV secretory pathway VirB10-like protein